MLLGLVAAGNLWWSAARAAEPMSERHLITLDPGHFHAALFQKQMLPGLSDRVSIYAPLGEDLITHLERIAQFNSRPQNPTHWQLEIHASSDFWEEIQQEPPGQVVILSGNNRTKIERIYELARHGQHVLADKPWIIEPNDLPKLEAALQVARDKKVILFDAMTQRFEITLILQKVLAQDPAIFGSLGAGSAEAPAVYLESLHYILKEVAGVPNLRPPWFFDTQQQGEGLTDVGTHLVDLVAWMLYPAQPLDYHSDIRVIGGNHWPTVLTLDQFKRVTGVPQFPAYLTGALNQGNLDYFANNTVQYLLRGHHVQLTTRWEFEPKPGAKDYDLSILRGSRSSIEIRPDPARNYRGEIFIIPARAEDRAPIADALKTRLAALAPAYPGLAVEEQGARFHLIIPDTLRLGHEAHFALVGKQFLEYVNHPDSLPAWEQPNLIAKYFITTQGVAWARKNPLRSLPKLPYQNPL